MSATELQALGLTFVYDDDDAIVYDVASKRKRSTELKPLGEDTAVTADNLCNFLQLYATHALVRSIDKQISAFGRGMGVLIDADLRATLRGCYGSEVQLPLCGLPRLRECLSTPTPHAQIMRKVQPPRTIDCNLA